ncbi:MAG: SDR family NAD(P)-dependent oxidoreductase [Thermoleophilia bacterium]|nr:SDR family NAD(P)-dependent oxidoreductase [Thermoleophilia bacterium]
MRVAVVTGGSSGIGAALAHRLAERSYHCVLIARGRERLELLAGETGCEAEVCDVADRAAVEAAARRIGERHPAVHLLVNNAGVPGRAGFLELEPERIEEVMRINYLGGVWCLRAFLPLLEAGAPSAVVNVASVAGTVSGGPSGPYSASKHAQVAFSRTVSAELAPRGIRTVTVNPGLTDTEGFPQDRFLDHPVWRHAVVSAERVAAAIVAALDSGRGEIFVPGYYRAATALQGLAPGTVTRLASRRPPGRYTRDR